MLLSEPPRVICSECKWHSTPWHDGTMFCLCHSVFPLKYDVTTGASHRSSGYCEHINHDGNCKWFEADTTKQHVSWWKRLRPRSSL